MPLFARTAPELELGYDPESTREGQRHKQATSSERILALRMSKPQSIGYGLPMPP